jgi:hypothetical protein
MDVEDWNEERSTEFLKISCDGVFGGAAFGLYGLEVERNGAE